MAEPMLLDAGGCGACAAAVEAAFAGAGLDRPERHPGRADTLLVAGCVNAAMRNAVTACRRAMPPAGRVVAVGDCAIDGGPFRGYAVTGGVGDTGEVAASVPGCPPDPASILAVLAERAGATEEAAIRREEAPAPAAGPALLPPAPRHRLADDDSSAG